MLNIAFDPLEKDEIGNNSSLFFLDFLTSFEVLYIDFLAHH
jgi:hypothetical protein